MTLSHRFTEALTYTATAHSAQLRKGTSIPYLSHLLAVASIVLEHGGNEDEAIAALLHDAVEDTGGKTRLEDIRRVFGENVARIVDGCTDADTKPKPPWQQRKEAHIARMRKADDSIVLVYAADKLHNARAILRDYRELGDQLWPRFKVGNEGTMWYYRTLSDLFTSLSSKRLKPLAEELSRTVSELERITQSG